MGVLGVFEGVLRVDQGGQGPLVLGRGGLQGRQLLAQPSRLHRNGGFLLFGERDGGIRNSEFELDDLVDGGLVGTHRIGATAGPHQHVASLPGVVHVGLAQRLNVGGPLHLPSG